MDSPDVFLRSSDRIKYFSSDSEPRPTRGSSEFVRPHPEICRPVSVSPYSRSHAGFIPDMPALKISSTNNPQKIPLYPLTKKYSEPFLSSFLLKYSIPNFQNKFFYSFRRVVVVSKLVEDPRELLSFQIKSSFQQNANYTQKN